MPDPHALRRIRTVSATPSVFGPARLMRYHSIDALKEIIMENPQTAIQFCKLNAPVRDHAGRIHFMEQPKVIRKVSNLDREMLLVQFADGATTFLFPNEVTLY
jgi:hypothetical protein